MICLIIPPSPFLLNDKSIPWLGPLWIAACLRDRGYTVSILDLAGRKDYAEAAIDHAISHPEVTCYGLTATAPDYHLAVEIAKSIKSVRTDVRLILGGAHASTDPASCEVDGWDAIVSGDGFIAAETALHTNGIIWASGRGQIVEDLDILPFPARDLIDLDSYYFLVNGKRATAVISSFGCPMACTFCCGRDTFVYRKLRTFSPQRILREWDWIRDRYPQFEALQDYADEWNIPSDRAIELANVIAKHSNKWFIRCFIKAEFFTDDVASAMANAGVVEVLCGIESGSDRILKLIKKKTTWEINGKARETAARYGIRFKASTMVGLPSETKEDAEMTKRWLLTFKPDDFDITVFQPMRGSPIADRPDVEGKGLHLTQLSTLPYKTVPGEYKVEYHTDGLSAEEILNTRNEIDKEVRQALGLSQIHRHHESSMGQATMVSS